MKPFHPALLMSLQRAIVWRLVLLGVLFGIEICRLLHGPVSAINICVFTVSSLWLARSCFTVWRRFSRANRIVASGIHESVNVSVRKSENFWLVDLGQIHWGWTYFLDSAFQSQAQRWTGKSISGLAYFSFDPKDPVVIVSDFGALMVNPHDHNASTAAAQKLLKALRHQVETMEYGLALTEVLHTDPNHTDARVLLGHQHLACGRNDNAILEFSKVIACSSIRANADVYFVRALAYAKANRFADALRDVDHALRLSPAHADAMAFRADISNLMEANFTPVRDVEYAELLAKFKALQQTD